MTKYRLEGWDCTTDPVQQMQEDNAALRKRVAELEGALNTIEEDMTMASAICHFCDAAYFQQERHADDCPFAALQDHADANT